MPICEICEKEFEQSKYYRGRIQRYCSKECRKKGFGKYLKEYIKNYWKTHPDKYLENRMKHSSRVRKMRMTIIIHYGGNPPKCACCGENAIEFLTVDHINRDGYNLRKTKLSQTSAKEYYRIVKEGFPEGIQILCMNCNWARRGKKQHFCPVHHPELY